MSWTSTQYNAAKAGHQTEHALQASCVRWFRNRYPRFGRLLFAIPNGADLGGKTPIARAKNWQKLELEGAVKGASDLFLAVPSGKLSGLFIEMKTPKGKQSEFQKRFEAEVVGVGYGYVVPRSHEEFERVVRNYMERGEY